MRKLIQSGAMCQMSFYVGVSAGHYPSESNVPVEVAGLLSEPFWNSLSRISLMTMSLFSFTFAFDHHFAVDEPSPWRSV